MGLDTPLLIVADENIPYVKEAFGLLGEVRMMAGRQMTAHDLRHADALLVRSVTQVNAALLAGSRIQFVASATIGTDHVDLAYLKAQNIAFAHAPGSNAGSVVEYVVAALHTLAVRQGISLRGKQVGIIGCGQIGSRLAKRLPALGMEVLMNDPPRAERAMQKGERHPFVSLEAVLTEADVVTMHVPFTRIGKHPTYHLLDAEQLEKMKPGAWLLNTARGAVVSNAALKAALEKGRLGATALDVWEAEPTPDPALIRLVDLATPHVAGYSYDGKVQGTVMLYDALLSFFGLLRSWDPAQALAPATEDQLRLKAPEAGHAETDWLHGILQQMYDLSADDLRFRGILTAKEPASYFANLRKTYPRRRAFERHHISAPKVPKPYQKALVKALNVRTLDGSR